MSPVPLLHPLGRWGLVPLLALLVLCGVNAQPTSCTDPAEVQSEQLHGVWTVDMDGRTWALHLGPHPEHTGSLRGELHQGPLRYPVAADLEDGEFTLEESHDGQRIAATWLGSPSPGACGMQLQGQREVANGPTLPFVMRRKQAP